MAEENGAGDVGGKAVLARAEINQQRIACFDAVIFARFGMGAGRAITGSDDGRKGQIIGPFGKDHLHQFLFDLFLGLAELHGIECRAQGAFGNVDRLLQGGNLGLSLDHARGGNFTLGVDDPQVGLRFL